MATTSREWVTLQTFSFYEGSGGALFVTVEEGSRVARAPHIQG